MNETQIRKPLRILLLAPTCDGEDVGEAWSTFQWVLGIARHHDVTVLSYSKRGHRSLSVQLEQAGVKARVITWNDLPLVDRFERLNSILKPGYAMFYRRARRWLKRALARGEHFDGAHQLAPLALRYPSPLAGLGIPWILGPVGGSVPTPPGFKKELGRSAWYMKLRLLDEFRLRRDPLLRYSIRDAQAVIVVAPYVDRMLGVAGPKRIIVESETGVLKLPERQVRPIDGPIRILYVGRIVRTKGLLYGLHALASMEGLDWQLDVAGSGPDEAVCREFAREFGLEERIQFHGQLARTQVHDLYAQANLFLFPSFREASGNVIFEALSHAVPVLCCDAGGPGFVARTAGSVCVPAANPEQLVDNLRVALRLLLTHPGSLAARGEAGRDFIERVALWPLKIQRMLVHYEDFFRPHLREPASQVDPPQHRRLSGRLKSVICDSFKPIRVLGIELDIARRTTAPPFAPNPMAESTNSQ